MNNKITNKELARALKIIYQYCKQSKSCDNCLLDKIEACNPLLTPKNWWIDGITGG